MNDLNSEHANESLGSHELELRSDKSERKLRTMVYELGRECVRFVVALPAHMAEGRAQRRAPREQEQSTRPQD